MELLRWDRVSRLIASSSGRRGTSLWREEVPAGASWRTQISIKGSPGRARSCDWSESHSLSWWWSPGGDAPLSRRRGPPWDDGDRREATRLWAGDGDRREATCLLVGDRDRREATPSWGGDGTAVIDALLRRQLGAPWGDAPLRRRWGPPWGDAPLRWLKDLLVKSRCLEGGDSLEKGPPSVCRGVAIGDSLIVAFVWTSTEAMVTAISVYGTRAVMRRGSKPAWTGIHAALLNEDQGGQHQERRLYVR